MNITKQIRSLWIVIPALSLFLSACGPDQNEIMTLTAEAAPSATSTQTFTPVPSQTPSPSSTPTQTATPTLIPTNTIAPLLKGVYVFCDIYVVNDNDNKKDAWVTLDEDDWIIPEEWYEMVHQARNVEHCQLEVYGDISEYYEKIVFQARNVENCQLEVFRSATEWWAEHELVLGDNTYYWSGGSPDGTKVSILYYLSLEKGRVNELTFNANSTQREWETQCKPLVRKVLTNIRVED